MKSLACFAGLVMCASAGALSLEEGFRAPPASAKPHTWYHMMNGNVTKEGITCDFEALAKAGIGGVQMFDAGCNIPAGPLDFNSPAWFDMFKHAHKEAKRLGLEICIPNCSGWSSSGGPWNMPSNGMKIVTFREVSAKGPSKFSAKLPCETRDNGFYEDIAVIAYPAPRPGASISNLPGKTLFARTGIVRDAGTFDAGQIVARASEIDLTSAMKADGTLEWDVPAGDWKILRIGYMCNGRCNHPASKCGRGLEVDKLSASAMDYHFDQYVGRLCKTLGIEPGKIGETGFNNILVDSYEVGMQNWTQGFDKTFEKRTGYSPRPYLPVFAGRVVGSVDESERFLEDFRRVVADLFAENYAGRLTELCHKNGLLCSIEPYGNSPADNLQYGQDIDIPMAEFWSTAARGDHGGGTGNSRIAATIAHVWGRRYAATESFTASPGPGGRWLTTPFSIKSQGDKAFADGINRIIYHRFTHQPWPGNKYVPGMTMGRWGMHLDRTQTWWKYAGDWFKYQTRCQWMLQEGTFNADVLYFCGEQAPNNGGVPGTMRPPAGYDWDVCATKALLGLKIVNGDLVVPGGVSYKLLVLPPSDTASETVLNKIGALLDAGAKVCCAKKPVRSPGLRGYPAADGRVRALADAVWAKGVMECSPAEALSRIGVAPDFASAQKAPAPSFIHRRNASADWYFVALDNEFSTRFEVSFRQTGRAPEIWDALTGKTRPAETWREENGRTFVTLAFEPSGSAFVVFRLPAAGDHAVKVAATVKPRTDVLPPAPKHTLVIKKALYGILDGGRPLCMRVDSCIKPGKKIAVENDALGGDPARKEHKQLEVTYVSNGKKEVKTVKEHDSFTLPAGAKLVSAWYGVIDPSWRPLPDDVVIDITEKVSAAVKDGAVSVSIGNGFAGRDPLFGTVKKSRIAYVYDGEENTVTLNEDARFTVPSDFRKIDKFLEWEWRVGTLMAWQPLVAEVASANGKVRRLAANPPAAVLVSGAWDVSFPEGWDAPGRVTFPDLVSWTLRPENGIKYFSGTATYTKRISVAPPAKGSRLFLDLGDVRNFAEVTVNGRTYPVLWKPPFRVDITDSAASTSTLDISVKVTNLWANRLIGDDRLFADDCEWLGRIHRGAKEVGIKELPQWVKEGRKSPTGRHTFTTWKHWSKHDALLPSGLLGPVFLRVQEPARP